jgi:hypothetical protein
MTVETGSGKTGTNAGDTSCAGFTPTTTIVPGGTLKTFTDNHHDFASALDTQWSAAAQNESKDFRFTLTVQDTNAAQGKSAAPQFTWETQP